MSPQAKSARTPPAIAPAPSLVSLPDDALLLVFAHFYGSEKLRLFDRPSDATNLAAVHPRFARLHRRAVVTRLEVTADCGSTPKEDILAHRVQRELRRHPRAERLYVGLPRCSRRSPLRIELFVGAQLRAVEVKDARLHWDSVRSLLRACPRLVELAMIRCGWTPERGERKKLDGVELETWSRLRVLRLWDSSTVLVDLVSNFALFELHALRELDLSGSKRLERSLFDACASLSKVTTLSLRATSFSSADAARILPRLPALRELVVSQCQGITSALWDVLPPTLEVLRASGSWLFRGANRGGVAGRCGGAGSNLRVLDADFSCLETWEPLRCGFGELEELYLAYSEDLTDELAAEALAAMPRLEKLNLHGCPRVGDRAAAAIARHPKLSVVWVELTAIGDAGIVELSRTFRPNSLRWVRGK